MADLKDTAQIQGLMSAVKDIMRGNQNLYQQDLEKMYGYTGNMPEEPVDVSGSDTETEVEVSSEQPIETSADLDVSAESNAEDAVREVADETGSEVDQG
jgi:hypothetical protein